MLDSFTIKTKIIETINSTDYYKSIKILLKECTHLQQVKFAYECAKDLEQFYDIKKYPKIYKTRNKCLELLGTFILKEGKVEAKFIEELRAAADAAHAAASAAADAAAYAATYGAYAATYGAYAATYGAYAADAAAYAAHAAYAAASAAADAANAAYIKKLYFKLITLLSKEYDLKSILVLYSNNTKELTNG